MSRSPQDGIARGQAGRSRRKTGVAARRRTGRYRPAAPLRRLGSWAGALFDALVPVACTGCRRGVDRDGAPLCPVCRSRLPRLPRPRCARCAQPLGNLGAAAGEIVRCGTCEWWPDVLVAADVPFAFSGLAAQTVRALKYERWRALAPYMASCMAEAVEVVRRRLGGPETTWLVPVPLGRARLRERGFNQAEELARALAARNLGQVRPVLERRKGGVRQARASGAQRRENVAGLFRFRPPPEEDRSSGEGPASSREERREPLPGDSGYAHRGGDSTAIIVDDVLTTGSTAAACAQALGEAGFSRVGVVSFARTLRPLDPG